MRWWEGSRTFFCNLVFDIPLHAAPKGYGSGFAAAQGQRCDGVVSVVPGRPSARAAPGWAVDGVAVAAGSDPGWVEDCGCAVSDSARRARRRADSRTVTFSMAARSVVVTKQVLGRKHKMSRAGQASGGSNDYIHGRCVCQEPRPHTRLPTRSPGLTLNRPPVPR